MKVEEDAGLDCYFFAFEKEDKIVYIGERLEYKTLTVEWADEHTLLVGDTAYTIT